MKIRVFIAVLCAFLMMLSSTKVTRSVQPPVDAATLHLGHDARFMTNVTADPVGLIEGGSWEKDYPVLRARRCWAIFVGVNLSYPPLDNAWADAIEMKTMLEGYSGYAASRDRLHLGTNLPSPGNASWQEIKDSISWVLSSVSDHDVVVFYFSGHGWRNSTGGNLPGECEGTPLDEPDHNEEGIVCSNLTGIELVSDDMLFAEFSRFHSKYNVGLILIFDTDYSGGMADGAYDLQNLENPHAVLMSCNRHQNALEDTSLQHGAYTRYVLEGLDITPQSTTRADSKSSVGNNDGITTARELHDYAALYVTDAFSQNPCLRLSETKNRELIANIYEPLIRFDETKISEVGLNGNPYYYTSIDSFEPHLANLMGITPDGLNWTYEILTNVTFHDWIDKNLTVHTGESLTPEDVQYSFERALVQDQRDSPTWMIYYPLTGNHTADVWDIDHDGDLNAIEASVAANALKKCITRDDIAGTLTFHMSPLAVGTMGNPDFMLFWNQTLAQACYIVNKKFAIDYGCWPGSWDVNETYSWAYWRRYPSNDYSPLDQPVPEGVSKRSRPVMCGTGPYNLTSLSELAVQWRIDRFTDYWRGWPATGNPSFADTVIGTGSLLSNTRTMQLLSGDSDYADVLIADMALSLPFLRFTWTSDVGRIHFERDWLQGWCYNQLLYPSIYAYHLYKTVPESLQNVMVSIDSFEQLFSPSPFNCTYVFHGQMRIGCTDVSALTGNANRAVYVYLIRINRTDTNPNIEVLPVEVGLKRAGFAPFEFPNRTTIFLLAGSSQMVSLNWYEDGNTETLPANPTGMPWNISAEAWPLGSNLNDTDPTDNRVENGAVKSYTGLVGDINGDGVVDIFDAIILSGHYGELEGHPNWAPDCNLSPVPDPATGKQIIDIFDAIMLSNYFGGHMP